MMPGGFRQYDADHDRANPYEFENPEEEMSKPSLSARIAGTLDALKTATFPDGLACHCDPETGAVPCELCGEQQLLKDMADALRNKDDLLAACQQLVKVAGMVSQVQFGDGLNALKAGRVAIADAINGDDQCGP